MGVYATAADFAKYAMKLREQALLGVEPQVFAPVSSHFATQRFPWKTNVVTTVFWVGEKQSTGKLSREHESVWDKDWQKNYGGVDNPDSSARRDYIPLAFAPRQNPFYCALPYNDVTDDGQFKPEVPSVIPWFNQAYAGQGQSVCKDHWIAIRKGNRTCYAQWEDCGPFRTDHFEYVFQSERPRPNANHGAGLNVSPAVRDCLGLAPTDVTDWQFVDVPDVPPGPWRDYGDNNHFVIARRQADERVSSAAPTAVPTATAIATPIPTAAALFNSPASGRTIDGQVFIVTAGAQAIKLALVQVAAVAQADIEKHISDINVALVAERAKADAAVKESTEAVRRAKWAIRGGGGQWEVRALESRPTGAGPLTFAEGKEIAAGFDAAKERVPKAEQRLSEALAHQKLLQSAAPYFVDLPTPTATAKTDADGRFQLNIPDEGDYVLLASSTRVVFNSTEQYFWIVRLKSQESKVTLSNDNLTTVLGKKLGEVAVALLAIVRALKNQPGFDRAAFDADIRELIARTSEDDSLIKTIFENALDSSESTSQ